ncbi:uncharacterized protein LOC104582798 isoform X2 [Brachypodium distachyon]|uniref:uncharacterized protein LOC104582798 isoform X2 n=1 Tax=Brachypodium distachyon TaxID=15368 RepID=UPI00052FFD37|nr:uncharacterized protein LOC104582798 isoform X2 [Brachypodium distachyon]|eukprot:XP_010231949.1 uncharacterized protein LOC104582798 isoform X2 [Brachypodium distachyon]
MAPLLPLRSLMHAPSSGRRPLLSIPEAAITGDPLQIRLGRDCEFPGYNAFRRFRVEVAMERVELLHLIADLVEAIFYADNPEWRLDVAGLQLKLSEYTKRMSNYNGVLAFPCF